DARVGRHDLAHRPGRVVGRAVVHHQDLEPVGQLEQGADERRDVVALVVGRDDDELLHQPASPAPARAGFAGCPPTTSAAGAPRRAGGPRFAWCPPAAANPASTTIRLATESWRPSRTARER